MVIQMSEEQIHQVITRVGGQSQARVPRHITQDATEAPMNYEVESSPGFYSPIRTHLATLHLRPVEEASLPQIAKVQLTSTFVLREITKVQLPSTPVLRTADPTQPFLRIDSTACALGATVLQGEAPEKCPIEYSSWRLNETERNYSPTEREVLSIVRTINKFGSYVEETSRMRHH
jgi:hypothetical protein